MARSGYREERIADLNDLQKEIRTKCKEVKVRIDEIWALDAKNRVSHSNLYGCLRGHTDEYMLGFEYTNLRIEQRLEMDRN